MKLEINEALASRLIAAQFPCWSGLQISKVRPGGWDNRTFRLGDSMSMRLPSAARYANQVAREQTWLPMLAPELSTCIPTPVAKGLPSAEYPWDWSIFRWIEGESVSRADFSNRNSFGRELANFLCSLQHVEVDGGPKPGQHNFYRGGSLAVYNQETLSALKNLEGVVETQIAHELWDSALTSKWENRPVWVHGDFAAGNLLSNGEHLTAVIDFGNVAIGDPSCDLTIAWTLLEGSAREVFRQALDLDEMTWARARGWALWKTSITLEQSIKSQSSLPAEILRVFHDVVNEHRMVS